MTTAARASSTTAADPATRASPLWKKAVGRGVLAAGIVSALYFGAPMALGKLDYFHVQTVQLEGARFLTPTAVISALGADTTASTFDDPARFVAKVEGIPLVATATVRRRLPGTLVVAIVERIPVALVATRDGFRGVDSAGTQLPIDPAISAFDAPVVLPASGPIDSAADRRLFKLLGTLRANDPALFDDIEEVRRVSATEWHLRTTRQLVRVTPEVTLGRLADIFPVQQDLARRRVRAAELDLRFRNLVIARLP